ncbi:hypothetical protein OV450_3395 [Actinobacteria bacterium OV450]|nr:hypothetical protein OV450_3395 [Actinobacteria bacterium OV450]
MKRLSPAVQWLEENITPTRADTHRRPLFELVEDHSAGLLGTWATGRSNAPTPTECPRCGADPIILTPQDTL